MTPEQRAEFPHVQALAEREIAIMNGMARYIPRQIKDRIETAWSVAGLHGWTARVDRTPHRTLCVTICAAQDPAVDKITLSCLVG